MGTRAPLSLTGPGRGQESRKPRGGRAGPALLVVNNFGVGLIMPNASHQMGAGALASAIVAALVPTLGGGAMALSMATFAVTACGLFVMLSRIGMRQPVEQTG